MVNLQWIDEKHMHRFSAGQTADMMIFTCNSTRIMMIYKSSSSSRIIPTGVRRIPWSVYQVAVRSAARNVVLSKVPDAGYSPGTTSSARQMCFRLRDRHWAVH